MKKFGSKIRNATILIGLLGTQWIASGAVAQDQIRLNPAYKAPSELSTTLAVEDIISGELSDDFIEFLTPHEEAEQYILLTEPKDRQKSFVTLGVANERTVPLLQVDHEFQYNPSMSFSLPATSPNVGSSVTPGLLSSGTGGSQVIVSLNPSRKEISPFNSAKSLQLVLGSSFINQPANRYATFLSEGYLSQSAYNLSLGLGYSGFRLGASYSRNNSLFSSDLTGFDLGFGYMGNSWSANVRVGEYRRDRSLLLAQEFNIFDQISAYELGAAYRLFSNVSLTGRFTYYSYGMSSDFTALEDVQSLIFGTNLSF